MEYPVYLTAQPHPVLDFAAAELTKYYRAVTGVELTAGTHTVELRYYPQGLHEGLLISGGALFVLAVIVASMYIRKKKQGKTSAKMRRTVEKEPDGDLKLRN